MRLLVVDDNTEFLEILVSTLRSDFVVVGALSNGESVLAQVGDLNPEIIILDISLPDINGFEVTKRLKKGGCGAKVLFLSTDEQPHMVQAGFDIGACGYVFKSRLIPDLIDAIHAVSEDNVFWSSSSLSPPYGHK
jgi:DNA-binding NarL/FixJ family response regulator